jgi:hypothetical protein
MTRTLLPALTALTLFTACAPLIPHQGPTVSIGDASGFTTTVNLRRKDLKPVCSLEHFREGFRYTYMSMWNKRVETILEAKPAPDVAAYYSGKLFHSGPGIKAALNENPRSRDGYNECQEGSHQQGKMHGFLYALDDLKSLEEGAPK